MWKLLLTLFISTLFTVAYSQTLKEMRVVGRAQKMTDGEIITRKDANGRFCAAIKVVSDMDGYSYDSWDGIVDGIQDMPGQDIVYLTPTERVLEIFKSGYKSLKIILLDIDITLHSQEMWQIQIAGEGRLEELPVTFRYTPEQAKLFINGVNVENTPTHILSVGEHTIKLELTKYQSIEETIEVNEQQVFFEWQMEGKPNARLHITTIPDSATVFLDGVKLGESPIATFFPEGSYPLRIIKNGYVTVEKEGFNVSLPEAASEYEMEENTGYLTIKTCEEATVYINGKKVDNPNKMKLISQLVQVKVTMPKAEDLEIQTVLKKGDDQTLVMYPDFRTGTLQVTVKPIDANIEVIGDAGEYYTSKGMSIFDSIPVGSYTIRVSVDNYQSQEKKIQLSPNEILEEHIQLEELNSIAYKGLYGNYNFSADYAIDIVFIQGGEFQMGCSSRQINCDEDEKPLHAVEIPSFYLGKFEITNWEFCVFLNKMGNQIEGETEWLDINSEKCLIKYDRNGFKPKAGFDDYPVVGISWYAAKAYCNWLSKVKNETYRLPTEAEWEYVAKGGSIAKYDSLFYYAGSNDINEVAWYIKNSQGSPQMVGTKNANQLGVFDLTGNVWEWCSDWYDPNYYSASEKINPQGPGAGGERIIRGGSSYNEAIFCSITNRNNSSPENRYPLVGFRIVREVN